MIKIKKTSRFISLSCAFCLLVISGCSTLPRTELDAREQENPGKLIQFERMNTIGLNQESESIIKVRSRDFFDVKSVSSAGNNQIPDIQIPPIYVSDASLYDIFTAMLTDTGIHFTMTEAAANTKGLYSVSLSGKLAEVLERITNISGLYYEFRNKGIHLKEKKTFTISLPPMGEPFLISAKAMIESIGAENVTYDLSSHTVIFKANKNSASDIQNYINHIKSKDMIVYDINIWEVVLTDGRETAIDWSKLMYTGSKGSLGLTGTGRGALSDAINLTGVFTDGKTSIETIIGFLKTQGTLKTISQPKLMLVAGTESVFTVGTSITYVSKVGSTLGSTVSQTTVETDQIDTGITMKLYGDINGDTIYSRVDLDISDLTLFNDFSALGTELKLPQTVARKLQTQIRNKPGQMILLAGINTSRDNNSQAGAPGLNNRLILPSKLKDSVERSELVMILRPRLVRFVDRNSKDYDVLPEASF